MCTRECMPLLPRTCVSHKPWLPADKKIKSPELFRGILFTSLSLSLSWLVSIATHHDSTTLSFSHGSECTQRQAPARRIGEKLRNPKKALKTSKMRLAAEEWANGTVALTADHRRRTNTSVVHTERAAANPRRH